MTYESCSYKTRPLGFVRAASNQRQSASAVVITRFATHMVAVIIARFTTNMIAVIIARLAADMIAMIIPGLTANMVSTLR